MVVSFKGQVMKRERNRGVWARQKMFTGIQLDTGLHFVSFIHLSIYPPIQSSTHAPTHLFTHSFVHYPSTHLSIHLSIHPPSLHPLIYLSTHLFIHSFTHPSTPDLSINSSTYSSIHPCTHIPICSLVCPFTHPSIIHPKYYELGDCWCWRLCHTLGLSLEDTQVSNHYITA